MDGSQPRPILPGVLVNRFDAHEPNLIATSESNLALANARTFSSTRDNHQTG